MQVEGIPAQVHVAVISHRHGNNLYAGRTYRALQQQIYDYVVEWWDEHNMDGEPDPADMATTIERYFEDHSSEWLEVDIVEMAEEE